jgi:hypothetical protein
MASGDFHTGCTIAAAPSRPLPSFPHAPHLKPTTASFELSLQVRNFFWRAESVNCLELGFLLDLYQLICWDLKLIKWLGTSKLARHINKE